MDNNGLLQFLLYNSKPVKTKIPSCCVRTVTQSLPEDETVTCVDCGEDKPLSEYHKRTNRKYIYKWCKTCHALRVRTTRKNNLSNS